MTERLAHSSQQLLEALSVELPELGGICRREDDYHNKTKTLILCDFKAPSDVDQDLLLSVDKDLLGMKVYNLRNRGFDEEKTERLRAKEVLKAPGLGQYTLTPNYRRLKYISGRKETGKDEENWENWVETIESYIEEDWAHITDPERKRRIREALRPPAFDDIFNLRQDCPDAASEDYMRALETAFGSTESGEELFFFRSIVFSKNEMKNHHNS